MKDSIFHLAIPCRDLDEAQDFYEKKLGCKVGRRSPDRISFNFFSAQLICHLHPEKVDNSPEIYPRHFGINFQSKEDFHAVLEAAKKHNLEFIQEPFLEYRGTELLTFFLKDPSNNVLQFKSFLDGEIVY
ncbi:VOC family protein [Aetokthonos hydrillicola Thurmond2011]|jgi:hypothetical protein|uniref:VOC family protein n=1 Tax=Aetokthonos hydrillicola Thurmond2011 TaxID=2712845 RepID=A0AAP5IAZ2_9CYAN|nr:VOC family protein [Aetokthonos hydrillicola]MBO3461604.1 glyoxalase [Aetokthonos hydrillicola CCALA 1050]MBW4589303.1 VOC family protein [Aetokthonos hydrillicola CCALA 1050]MDR9898163.1 VOC family protein [Aetokthonos hydrillicola Thurmond2011]